MRRMNFPVSLDDQSTLLLAAGLGAIVGVLFGGWIMTALHKLMMGLVKLALLGFVVVVGIFLWNGFQKPRPVNYPLHTQPYQMLPTTQPIRNPTYHQPPAIQTPDRWWEQ